MKRAFALLCLGLFSAVCSAQDTFGTIDRKDPAFDKLIPKDAKIEKLATGFKWVEGPVWIKNGGFLLFSDIPNNAIHQFTPGKGLVRDFIKPAGYTGKAPRPGTSPTDEPGSNGLMLDAEGRLTLCEHGDSRVARLDKDFKNKVTLAHKYNGKKLNSPNDLVYHSNGELYFTDPPYGMVKHYEDPARELDFCGVYRLKKDGTLDLLTKEMTRPNGIALSPDEKWLYVANSDPKLAIWKKFPVKEDGTIGEGKVFYDATSLVGKKPGLPDGLKVDVDGNVFATGPGGVLVFNPEGALLGLIDTGVPTANCAFGEDGTILYIAADKSLARIRTSTKGKGF
ncbi:MAG: SMP-30/gluconolactonase/LRE family protein [Gemmataceae bacterium]